MQISLAKFTFMLAGWLALFSAALFDARREVVGQDRSIESFDSADARTRWNSLSPEQQQRLRKRFEHLQSLSSQEREDLMHRATTLKREEERLLRRLSPEHRRRLKLQPEEKRRQLISEMVEAERRERGARIESKLPKKTREWLQNAPPEERSKRLERFRQQTRERISSRAVEGLAKALGFGSDEVKRLERLPLEDRMRTVMNLRRKLDARQRTEGGMLEDFTQEMWSELESLPPEEYFTEVLRMRHEGGLRNLSPQDREERQDRRELTRELRQNLRVLPDDLVELSSLTHEERRAEVNRRRRARLMATMSKFEVLSKKELAALEKQPDEEFFKRAFALSNGWASVKLEAAASDSAEASEAGEPSESEEITEPSHAADPTKAGESDGQ